MFKPLTPWGKAYFILVNLAGVAAFLFVAETVLLEHDQTLPLGYLAIFIATLAVGIISVKIPGINSLISLGDVFIFTTVLFFGAGPAALLAGVEGFLGARRHTGRFLSALSTLSVMTISVLAAGLVYENLVGYFWKPSEGLPFIGQLLVPLGAMALTHFLLNSTLVAGLTAVVRRLPFYKTWKDNYLWTSLTFFSGALAAGMIYLFLGRLGPGVFVVGGLILLVTYFTYKTYLGQVEEKNRRIARMNKVHLQTIEALAMAIDAKGQTTYGHLRRVQASSVALAEHLGVDEATLEGIRAAALLHDVGKLSVPDYILNKPGQIPEAEKKKLRTYPRIGAEILGNVDFPYPVVPMIRHHQERWDGSGYPDGVSNDNIPIGARIIALADCADAMRCPRSYRPVATREDVTDYMKQQAGAHFDPRLVEVFCENFDAIEARVQEVELPKMDGVEEIASIHREHAATLFEGETDQSVLSDISASRHEAQALYDLARDLGASLSLEESLSIIMKKIRSLISFDTGVIYLLEPKTGLIVPAHVEGENVGVIRRKSIRRGEGITGWVVDNMKNMLNARPELDFYGGDVSVGKQYESACVVPLKAAGQCIGTVTLYSREDKHFSSEDERILDLVVPQATSAIQNARSYAEKDKAAMTDTLTGLPNSRYLYRQLEKEMSQAKRKGRTLGIVVLDLDRFKPINDAFGHHVGDEGGRRVRRAPARSLAGAGRVRGPAGPEGCGRAEIPRGGGQGGQRRHQRRLGRLPQRRAGVRGADARGRQTNVPQQVRAPRARLALQDLNLPTFSRFQARFPTSALV
jgi:putative nucleotidyltransferase with HDIG domain